MEHTVTTPEWDFGSAEECAAFLRIKETAFLQAVKEGRIPPGIGWNRDNVTWRWDTIVGVALLAGWLNSREAVKPRTEKTSDELG